MFFDDASTDDTLAQLTPFLAANPAIPVRVIANKERQGLGGNFATAAHDGRGQYLRYFSCDNVETEDCLRGTLRVHRDFDMVVMYYDFGLRSAFRRNISDIYTKLVNAVSGLDIKYYNGANTFNRKMMVKVLPISRGFGFFAEVAAAMAMSGATYTQFQGEVKDTGNRRSTAFRWTNVIAVVNSVIQIWLRRLKII
jgi:glycosyltransferase involved in cell wall biosynthesis